MNTFKRLLKQNENIIYLQNICVDDIAYTSWAC